MELRKMIERIVAPMLKKNQRRGKAINIDTNKCICDVDLGNGTMLHGVKLKSIEGGSTQGIVIVPKDKSYVMAAMVEGVESDWCLIQWDEIDSAAFFFKNGGKQEMKDNGEIHLNGDNKGAMVVIQNLVNKLNALEQKHDGLVVKFNAHFHGNGNNGANTTVATPQSTDSIGTQTTVNDLKNDKVKHGA